MSSGASAEARRAKAESRAATKTLPCFSGFRAPRFARSRNDERGRTVMTALIDVDQLRTFIAIAETGSFTKAAEVVHKTQSAVSMQMKRLEERLERPVFARDGRASKLTEDGQC